MAEIMLDVDDVLYPCVDVIRQYLVDRHGHHARDLVTPTTWDLHEHWGIDKDKLWAVVRTGVSEGYVFTHGLPYSGVRTALAELRADGHKINLVTARLGRGRVGSTKRWLKMHGIKYDTLTFSEDKTILPADFALDDRPENFVALQNHCEAYLFDQPWNRHVDTPNRVHNLSQFVNRVRKSLGEDVCPQSTIQRVF